MISRKLAVAIPFAVAVLVFSNSVLNRWALDDHALIANNPAAHSIQGALDGFFEPYWPPDENGHSAGLYRPLATLSYAVEWTFSGGSPAVSHISNVFLHAFATGLVVLVALAWLSPLGAMVAGLVFAVHPVHTEAVANVIGRAEVMSAIGLLVAVVAARRYRRTASDERAWHWALVTLGAVIFAQLSKENGVVAIAIIALDHLVDRRPVLRPTFQLYWLVAALTLSWLYIWASIAGGAVDLTVAPGIRWLSFPERLATALPVQLEVVRLLVWPMNLAASYDPQLIPQRTEFGLLAVAGAIVAASIVLLGVALIRKAPAIAFGLIAAVISYAPTSNLVFSAGLMLGERTLYFSSIAPVLVVGWLASNARSDLRRPLFASVALILMVFGVRTVLRNPFWVDMRSVITNDLLEHPEGFRTQFRIGEAFEAIGDSNQALSYYLTAVELFDRDPFASKQLVDLALAMGRENLALSESGRAFGIAPFHADIVALHARTLVATGRRDSAIAIVREAFDNDATSTTARIYNEVAVTASSPDWAVRFSQARFSWLSGRPLEATSQLFELVDIEVSQGESEYFCWEFGKTRGIMEAIASNRLRELELLAGAHGCDA